MQLRHEFAQLVRPNAEKSKNPFILGSPDNFAGNCADVLLIVETVK